MKRALLKTYIIISGFVMFPALAVSSTMHYLVAFHSVQSNSRDFTQDACQQMMKPFTFSKQSERYIFDNMANPSYSDHQVIAYLPLNKNQFMEVDTVSEKFIYQNKTYNIISYLSSVTTKYPFQLSGIISNSYCKAAYVVLLDEPKLLNNPN